MSAGPSALIISLAVHGIGPGDEVITTAYTFASTAIAIIHRGADPVFCDVQPDTFNIDPEKIKEQVEKGYIRTDQGLKSKTNGKILKAIIPVHFGGQPADMEEINRLAYSYGLHVVEDAAHAIGAKQDGINIGKSRNLVCFSFYSNKNLTTGEGGMVVTDNDELEKSLRLYSLHGISKSAIERYKTGLPFYDIVCPGYKANLTDIQSALGVVQLSKLDRITFLRNRVAGWYDEFLGDAEELVLPIIKKENYSARHLYPVLLSPTLKPFRDEIIIELRKKKVYPSVHFIPVHFHSFFKEYLEPKEKIDLPITEDLFHREISLPIFPGLKKDEVKFVANSLKTIITKLKKKAL